MNPVKLTDLIESDDPERVALAIELVEAGEIPVGRLDEIRRMHPKFSELLDARHAQRERRVKTH